LKNAKTEVRFVRTADLELSILLRQVSNGSFAEAAAQRVTRRATAAMGRSCRLMAAAELTMIEPCEIPF